MNPNLMKSLQIDENMESSSDARAFGTDSAAVLQESSQTTGMGTSGQQAMMALELSNQLSATRITQQVDSGMMFPTTLPQLDKDNVMQLHALYLKTQRNEISKEDFVRHLRTIIEDQVSKFAAVPELVSQDASNVRDCAAQSESQLHTSAKYLQLSSSAKYNDIM